MKRTLYSIILLFAIQSCVSENKAMFIESETPANVTIPVNINLQKVDGTRFSEIIQWTKILPLETSPSSLISRIDKLDFYEGQVYLLNDPGRSDERLMVFDQEKGKYLRDIGKRGEAPTDFLGLRDFYIDRNKNELILLVAGKMGLMNYNTSGQHLRSKRTGLFGDEIEKMESEFLIYNEHNSTDISGLNYLIQLSSEGTLTRASRTYPLSRDGLAIGESGFIDRTYDQKVLFSAPHNDTIFHVQKESLLPIFIFNTGSAKPPLSIINNKEAMLSGKLMGYDYIHDKIGVTEDFLMFQFIQNRRKKKGVFDLQKKELYVDNDSEDFVNFLFRSCSYFTQYDNDEFVMVLSPTIFNEFRAEYPAQYEIAKAKFESHFATLEQIRKEDNPVLMFFKITI